MKKSLFLLFSLLIYISSFSQAVFEISGPESLCEGQSGTFTAQNCSGTLKWFDGSTGTSVSIAPTKTQTLYATCTTNRVNQNTTHTVIVTPVITISSNTGPCFEPNKTILTAAGGTSESRFKWKKDGVPIPYLEAASFVPDAPGDYTAELIHEGDWAFQHPMPDGYDILDVEFGDANNGLAVGDFGLMLRTTDGGLTWNKIEFQFKSNFINVEFTDVNTAWILSDNSKLYKSLDAGLTWVAVTYGLNANNVRKIFFLDSYNGWLIESYTANSRIFKTSDGGVNWTAISTGISYQSITKLLFTSALDGYIATNTAVFKTVNGGLVWTGLSTPNGSSYISELKHNTSNKLWLSSSDYSWFSTDGGINWSVSSLGPTTNMEFFNANIGVALTPSGSIYKTIDGGLTWDYTHEDSNISVLKMASDQKIVGVGIGHKLKFSPDFGITWNEEIENIPYVNSLHFNTLTEGWASGGSGLFHTGNGGKTWTNIPHPGSVSGSVVYFISENIGFVKNGGTDYINKTVDKGQSWTQKTIPGFYAYNSQIQFVNTAVGFIGSTFSDQLAKTIDGGETWLPISLPVATMIGFHFVDAHKGFITSLSGQLFKTIDGGSSWASINTGISQNIENVFFKNDTEGWISTYSGTKRTIDGGASWTVAAPYLLSNFNCIGSDTIWATTNQAYLEIGSIMKRSVDGGNSWTDHFVPFIGGRSNYFQFINGTTGWVLFPFNSILKFKQLSSTCESAVLTLNAPPPTPSITSNVNSDFICAISNVKLTVANCPSPNNLVWFNGVLGNTLTITDATSKVYYANCTNALGCKSTGKIELKFSGTEEITKSIAPPFCEGNSLTLTYSGPFNNNYEWFKDNSSLGFTASINANLQGDYYLKNYNPIAYTLLNPLPTDDTFLNVFQFGNKVIGVSNQGIYQSTDSGEYWNKKGGLYNVSDGYFFDENNGFIIHNGNNYVSKTVNGGVDFTNINLPVFGFWKKILFSSANRGFIVGQNEILRTTDGGTTWISQNSLIPPYNWQSIFFINELTGWVCGSNGKIFKTINGGDSWSEQNSNYNEYLNSIVFVSENIGFCLTNSGANQMLKTLDGGNSWFSVSFNTGRSFNAISFTNSLNGYVFGQNVSFKTTDGGNTWVNSNLDVSGTFIHGVKFIDSNRGYIYGANGYLLKSIDGGLTWNQNGLALNEYIQNIHFLDEQTGYVAGGNGFVARSLNGGLDWQKLNTNINENIVGLVFTTVDTGYVTGINFNIYKTTNGGDDWFTVSSNQGKSNKLYFYNKDIGWAIGGAGTILKTTNAGETWVSQSLSSDYYFNDIHFISAQVGWIVGSNDAVFKTTDGGETWTKLTSVGTYSINSVRFFDNNHGFVGSYNNLYETFNGGLSWTTVSNPNYGNASFNVTGLSSFGSNQLIVHSNLSIDKTLDGGVTWQSFPLLKTPNKNSFVSIHKGWSIYNLKSIYKYEASLQPCTSEVVAVGEAPPKPIITNSGDNIICEGTSLTLSTANCAGSVKWNTGFTGSSLTVTPQRNGAYYATCSDAAGCSSVASIGINVNETPRLTTEVIDPCQTLLLKADNLPLLSDLVWSKNGAPFIADSYELNGPNRTTQNDLGTFSVMNKSKNSWNNISPAEFKGIFTDIKFLTQNLGFAVAEGGIIYKSTDGGDSWELKNPHTRANLYEICIVDDEQIWIAGDELLYSLDAGENWTLMTRPENEKFTDIFFTDMNNGWLLSNHSIYKTTDGGSSWIKTYTTTSFLRTIHAFNNTVLVGGDVGFLVKSNDLGAAWQEAPLNTFRTIFDIQMYSDSLYWICGNYDVLRKSVDGGQTWINAYPNNDTFLTDIQVISDQDVVAFGNSQIYKSRDGGNSWQRHNVSGFTYELFAFDIDNILVAGYGMKKSVSEFTQWKEIGQFKLLLSDEPVRSMQFLDASNGYMVSRNVIGKTVDGGRNWSKTTFSNYTNLNDIFFVNESVGYTCGNANQLFKTIDSGQTWLSLSGNLPSALPSNLQRQSVYFKDVNTGWLTGTDYTTNYLIKTTDGGVTWNIIYTNTIGRFTKIKFNGSRGVILSDQAILVSNDEGASWSFSNINGISASFSDVQIFDENTLYVTSYAEEGFYFKSSDGGDTWVRKQFSVTGHTPTFIKFFNNNEGWIGTPADAFHTTDGGLTWEMSYLDGYGYSSMYFLNPNQGWAAGYDLLKLNTSTEPSCPATDTYVFDGINSTLKNPLDNIIANPLSGINEFKLNANYGTIQAENLILNNGTKAVYEAKSIELKPGFKADKGTVFTAEPGGCTN